MLMIQPRSIMSRATPRAPRVNTVKFKWVLLPRGRIGSPEGVGSRRSVGGTSPRRTPDRPKPGGTGPRSGAGPSPGGGVDGRVVEVEAEPLAVPAQVVPGGPMVGIGAQGRPVRA